MNSQLIWNRDGKNRCVICAKAKESVRPYSENSRFMCSICVKSGLYKKSLRIKKVDEGYTLYMGSKVLGTFLSRAQADKEFYRNIFI